MKTRFISFLTTFAVLVSICLVGDCSISAENYSFDDTTAISIENETINNDYLFFSCEKDSGNFSVTDLKTGLTFYSNPNVNENIKGANRTNIQSQLILILIDKMGNDTQLNSFVDSVRKSGLTVSKSKDKIIAVYKFPEHGIEIPVEYALDSDRLLVTVDADKVKSADEDSYLREIRILPYFCTGGKEDEGYFIVPDGCGSIIEFHSGKSPSYSQQLFGEDRGKSKSGNSVEEQPALLPAIATSFDNYSGNKVGIVAYVESGAALATAYADAETDNKFFNSAYFGFIYRDNDLVTLMDQSSESTDVIISEKNHVSNVKYKISYSFTGNSITDLAKATRERVFSDTEISKIKETKMPVYVKTYMSIRKTKYFLGIPYNGNQRLTSISNCEKIISEFDDIPAIMSLAGLDSDGAVGGRVDKKLSILGSIGNVSDLRNLIEIAESNNGAVYPIAEFTEFSKGNINNRVLSVSNLSIKRKIYDYGTAKEKNEYKPLYLLTNKAIVKNVKSWISSAKKNEVLSCAPISISNSPYRSGGQLNMDRNATQTSFVESLNEFKNSDFDLLLETAAAYALPYATHLSEMPISSSGFAACSYEVPFLQIVLHGVKSYSMPSINFSGNENYYMLKAIETGSSLAYTFVNSPYTALKETPLDVMNGSEYSLWKTKAKEQAEELADCMEGTISSYITEYQIINDKVRLIEYENGNRYLINYSEKDFEYNGYTVKAMDYILFGKENFK